MIRVYSLLSSVRKVEDAAMKRAFCELVLQGRCINAVLYTCTGLLTCFDVLCSLHSYDFISETSSACMKNPVQKEGCLLHWQPALKRAYRNTILLHTVCPCVQRCRYNVASCPPSVLHQASTEAEISFTQNEYTLGSSVHRSWLHECVSFRRDGPADTGHSSKHRLIFNQCLQCTANEVVG